MRAGEQKENLSQAILFIYSAAAAGIAIAHLQSLRVSAIADFGGQQKAAAAVFPAGCARDPPQTDTMGGGEVRWQHQRSVLEPNGIPARCRCPGGILT